MELDNIKLQTTWNDAANSINTNFAKVKRALENGGGGGGGGITTETDPIFSASPAAKITMGHIQDWDQKQEELIDGENIKTINGKGILGEGNIEISVGIEDVKIGDVSIVSDGVANIPTASPSSYGVTKLSSATNSTSTSLAATPSAVKTAYDLAYGRQPKLVSGTNIKTFNGASILGSGNVTIPTKTSQLENNSNFIDKQSADESYIAKDTYGELVTANVQGLYGGDLVYALPDQSNGDEDDVLLSQGTVKTINGQNIFGEGNIEISGGIEDVKIGDVSIVSDGVANIPTASASVAGVVTISPAINSTSLLTAASSFAVKLAYDLANGRQQKLVSGENIKTINGESILGSGDIVIEGVSSLEALIEKVARFEPVSLDSLSTGRVFLPSALVSRLKDIREGYCTRVIIENVVFYVSMATTDTIVLVSGFSTANSYTSYTMKRVTMVETGYWNVTKTEV